MVCNYFEYHIKMTNSWIPPLVNSKDGGRFCNVVSPLGFALRATTQHVGKAGGLQILRC